MDHRQGDSPHLAPRSTGSDRRNIPLTESSVRGPQFGRAAVAWRPTLPMQLSGSARVGQALPAATGEARQGEWSLARIRALNLVCRVLKPSGAVGFVGISAYTGLGPGIQWTAGVVFGGPEAWTRRPQ